MTPNLDTLKGVQAEPETDGRPARRPLSPNRRQSRPAQSRVRVPWYFVLPGLAFFLAGVLIPSLQGVHAGFTNWQGFLGIDKYIGFANFRRAFDDPAIRTAAQTTIIITVVCTVVENAIGLLLALGLQNKVKSRHILRLLFFTPVMMSSVVVGFIWQFMLDPNGPLSTVYKNFGMTPIDWLGSTSLALWAVILVIVWQDCGFSMIIFLAGLEGVPRELIEASRLDGAGPFASFRAVVWPALTPAITVNLMISLIRGLTTFDIVWVLTQGGPLGTTDTFSTAMYRDAFSYGEMGYATALAVILSIFVAVVAAFQYTLLTRRRRHVS